MKLKNIFAVLSVLALSCAYVHAAGPGGDSSGGGPGGESGGGPGGGPGGESGGGSGGSFTYDSFISVSTNANCLVREGTLYGYTSSLTTSVAPASSSTVGALADGVFAGNTAITTVNLANTSITEIPSDCFAGCTALKTVTLPASCTTIGARAFAGCTALATFTGSGVTVVNHDAFRGCTALTTAAVATSATLPMAIGSYAYSQSGVTGVDLSGVTTLGEGAFAGCESLTAVTVATSATLPAAVFAGCTALAVSDWSDVSEFGQAALSGIPATTLTLSSSATLGAYAFAADAATVATTLNQSALPTYDETAFLGREVSYVPVSGSVTRIEAMDLVDWLLDETASAGVSQPADYGTATLKTWLSDASNAYAYAYADDLAEDGDFLGLNVVGDCFIYNAPSDTALSIGVEVVGCYTLSSDADDWTADKLVWSDEDGGYLAAEETDTCFARLRFNWDW